LPSYHTLKLIFPYRVTVIGTGYRIATISGQHGYIEYVHWHATPNSPSMTKGEIEFINSRDITMQHHQTMGYSASNQPQFALLNLSTSGELWVKAASGVSTGTFRVTSSVNVTVDTNGTSDIDLSNNGGTLTVYDKLEDDKHIFVGDVKFGGKFPSFEVGGASPTATSGQATFFFHHYNVLAHQLRYNAGNLFLEAAGNGYGTNSNPNFFVGGNVGIGNINTGSYRLAVDGKIGAREVVVTTNAWPDYVFDSKYKLLPLGQLKSYIQVNKHLPDVPSEIEVLKNGQELGAMNAILLKKVEELTLYVIQLEEELGSIKEKISHQ
jgi:hypothetical protein